MRKFIVGLLLTILLIATTAKLVDANTACYVVTYLEADFTQVDTAIELLQDRAETSRQETGNMYYRVLQERDRPSHFALLEQWQSKSAQSAHGKSQSTTTFLQAIDPVTVSGYDERIHLPLETSSWSNNDGLFTLTHVDIKPNVKNKGVTLVKSLVSDSREAQGNIQFDALIQEDLTNHMTLVEIWNSTDDELTNAADPDIRSIRADLTRIIGGLYDRRLYTAID